MAEANKWHRDSGAVRMEMLEIEIPATLTAAYILIPFNFTEKYSVFRGLWHNDFRIHNFQ